MLVNKVSRVAELFPVLYRIGDYTRTLDNNLPAQLRHWVNALGLYVRTDFDRKRENLTAGGRYRSYFHAICEHTLNDERDSEIIASTRMGDFSHWAVGKFDQEVWERSISSVPIP